MGNRLEFFQAPSIISGFHLDIFTSDYPSHRVHPQYWQTRLRQYRVRPCNYWKHPSQKFLKNLKHLGTCWIEKAGGRLEHHRRVRSLELARAEERRVWLWSASLSPFFGEPSIFFFYDNFLPLRLGQLPILAISQPHALPWAGQAAGHARHPQVISRQRVADFELGRASDQAENMKTVYGLTDWFYITNV